MAKRRPAGDGMVRKRSDGRWEGRIVVGHKENGDPIFCYAMWNLNMRVYAHKNTAIFPVCGQKCGQATSPQF